jgi:hypothetical protein
MFSLSAAMACVKSISASSYLLHALNHFHDLNERATCCGIKLLDASVTKRAQVVNFGVFEACSDREAEIRYCAFITAVESL